MRGKALAASPDMVAGRAVPDVYADDEGEENAPTKVGRLAGVVAAGFSASGERPVAGAGDSGSRARVGFGTTVPLAQPSPVPLALANEDALDRTDKTALMPSAAAAVFARDDGRLDPSVLLGAGSSVVGGLRGGVGRGAVRPSASAIVRAAPMMPGSSAGANERAQRLHIRAELAAAPRPGAGGGTTRNVVPKKPSSTLAFLVLTFLGLSAGVFFAALFNYLVLS